MEKRDSIKSLLLTAGDGASLPTEMLNLTGVDDICAILMAGYTYKQIAKELNTSIYSINAYFFRLDKRDLKKTRAAQQQFHENKLHELRGKLEKDISYQYEIEEEEEEKSKDDLMKDAMKKAMLVEKRIKNLDIEIKSHQRALNRLDNLLNEGIRKDDSVVIENTVIISDGVLGYLPD